MVIENAEQYLLLLLLYIIIIIENTGYLFPVTAERAYLMTFTQSHTVHI